MASAAAAEAAAAPEWLGRDHRNVVLGERLGATQRCHAPALGLAGSPSPSLSGAVGDTYKASDYWLVAPGQGGATDLLG